MKVMVGVIAHRDSVTNYLDKKFDGDTASANIPYTDEAIEENRIFLNSKACYVNSDGRLTYDTNTDTIKFVLKVLTG